MCLDEHGLSFQAGEKFLKRKADLCNKNLSLSRGLICQALNACIKGREKILNCLDGNSPCGLMGMLWKKYLGTHVNVDINGQFPHSLEVIKANVESNKLDVNVIREDPCICLRQKAYDFILVIKYQRGGHQRDGFEGRKSQTFSAAVALNISGKKYGFTNKTVYISVTFLNCKASASSYFDSVFSNVKDDAVVVFMTSEDPSLHWKSPGVALRHYGGFIVKTSYFRELGIRLVIAEIARAAARYGKGIKVLCCTAFKIQQSFIIIIKVKKETSAAAESFKTIKRVLHCSMCEDRAYAPNSEYALELPSALLSCDCRRNFCTQTIHVLGPVWSGNIFCADFIEEMIMHAEEFPWGKSARLLLMRILEEARCYGREEGEPHVKKPRLQRSDSVGLDIDISSFQPSFYFNTHKHHPLSQHLLKISSIVNILRKAGYRASRTHFEPESVRTNANLENFIRLIDDE